MLINQTAHTTNHRKDSMSKTRAEQYEERMGEIQLMLTLLKVEAERAKEWKVRDEIDAFDIADLKTILSLLVKAYKEFCADAAITHDEVLRRAKDAAADDRN